MRSSSWAGSWNPGVKCWDRYPEVTSGRFSNASEVVREGLRLLEQREKVDQAKIEWLRAAAKEGYADIQRGDSVSLRSDEEIEDLVDQVRKEVTDKLGADNTRG